MAGFFIVLGDIKDENGKVITSAMQVLNELCTYGYYSTNLSVNSGTKKWSKTKTATFADYYSMRAGDYIFFFFNRKIYGVGELAEISESKDCKYWSYKNASKPTTYIKEFPIIDDVKPENRCICFFKPIKYFSYAIDMDEALTTYPDSFKSLRVIQGRSFIKMDDEEAQALFAVLTKHNDTICDESVDWTPPEFDDSKHNTAENRISSNPDYYNFTIESLLSNFEVRNENGISEEMAIEAALIECLNSGKSTIFDRITYVSHQVSASPAKPVEYMEWMDIFGYKTSQPLIEKSIPILFAINQYYVIEIKRDSLSLEHHRTREPKRVTEHKAVANQLMKYVDWVAKNYASGKYPMVKGIIVANDFDEKFIQYCKKMCVRNYNSGYRESTPSVWDNYELIKYSFDGQTITFDKVFPVEL